MPIEKEGASELPPERGSTIAITVVSAAPISTRNITGLRHMSLGSSLRSAPGSA